LPLDVPLDDLEIDSHAKITMGFVLEEELGIEIDPDAIDSATTIRQILATVGSLLP